MVRIVLAFLFWASIPMSIILGSWVPLGVGLLIMTTFGFGLLAKQRMIERAAHVDTGIVIPATWGNPSDHPKMPEV